MKNERAQTIIWSSLVLLSVFLCHGLSPVTTSSDSHWSIYTAISIIREGNTDLDEYRDIIKSDDYRVEYKKGHIYCGYPIGPVLLAVPFVFVFSRAAPGQLQEGLKKELYFDGLERWIASFIVGLSALFIYLFLFRLLHSRAYSLLLTFIFAFCTSSWSTASRALWQHGPAMLMLAAALYIIILSADRPSLIQFSALPLALSYVMRPLDFLSIMALTLYVFMVYRKFFLRYIFWGLVIIIPFLFYNLVTYNAPLTYYYSQKIEDVKFHARLIEALLAQLASPSRGLFIFSPVLIFSLYGIIIKSGRKEDHRLDYCLLAIMVTHWSIVSMSLGWWAGHSCGSRYLTDILPYLIYFLVPVVEKIQGLKGFKKGALFSLFIISAIISFLIHFTCSTNIAAMKWNTVPNNIDFNLGRIWDWKDIMFLRILK